ncbi:MAG: rhomboid family intramembrane serine protease [Deltaproteobacteria bacterium]|nr:rhomboid family intramembrane serine protease [Deltaproteobacteria bacterium]
MLLPVGDTPNPRGTPYVNYLLIGINIAVYLLVTLPLSAARPNPTDPVLLEYVRAIPQYWNLPVSELLRHISSYDLFIFTHGFKPADPSVMDLFGSMFLHAGFFHLAGNMLFLWIYGDNVEHRLGSLNYLFVYLATGMAATLFFMLFQLRSTTPMIGASGAISGVLGLYFLWFPRNKVRVFALLFPFFMDIILLPARWVLGFFLIIDNLLPFLFASGGGSGVAHGAHIGGFLAGLGIAYTLDRFPDILRRSKRRSGRAPAAERPDPGGEEELSPEERIHTALLQNDRKGAASLYLSIRNRVQHKEIDPADRLEIGRYLLREGNYPAALSVFRQYISDFQNGPDLDQACLGAGIALYQAEGQMTASYQYFLMVLDVTTSPAIEAEARRYLQTIETMQKTRIKKE